MIRHVMFFRNGNVACIDEQGNQVPEWQAGLISEHLWKMLKAKVITMDTVVSVAGRDQTVKEWIGAEELLDKMRSEVAD